MKYLIPVFFLISCNSFEEVTPNPASIELSNALEIWEDKNLNNYIYTLNVNCFCPLRGPNEIEIKNDNIIKVNGKSVSSQELQELWDVKSINQIFEIIEDKLSRNPYQYTLKFDADYGYPIDVYFDMDEMIADEEIEYLITNFKIK